MLENGFIDNITNTQHDFERYAVFPHLVVPDEGLEACNAVFAVVQDMTGDSQRDIFDVLQVIVIRNGQGNKNRAFCQRLFIVGQRCRSNALIRHDDHVARRRPNRRVAPVHIDNTAGIAAGQANVITHMDLLGYQSRNAGKEISQCILQGQGRCQAAGTQRCQQRRYGNAVGAENKQCADKIYA